MTPLHDLRYVHRADVYKGEDQAGTLVKTLRSVSFYYDPRYLQAGLPPLATSLPYEASGVETYAGSLPPYFTNLLPEGVRLYSLRDRLKTSLDDEMTLLLAVGRDCVGDVSVVPEGEDPTLPKVESATEPFNAAALFARAEAAEDPAALAGVQEKVSSSMLTLPVLSARGPAIVKLAPPRLPLLVRNEHFFLRMAQACGIPAAKSEIIRDPQGGEALWVTRFDRVRTKDGWRRLAQEDGCQLTANYPAAKYRIGLRPIAEAFVQHSAAPLVALQSLLAQTVFAYLIGNSDLHAKNVSLGETSQGLMPTPVYDVLSTFPYPDIDDHMALRMDGRDDRMKRRHYREFFGRYGVPQKAVDRVIDRIGAQSEPWLGRLEEIGFSSEVTEKVRGKIIRRRQELLAE